MRRMPLYLMVPLLVVACLAWPDGSTAAPNPRKPGAQSARKPIVPKHGFKGQVTRRKSGQKVFVVQGRKSGSAKTALMTPDAAATVRNKMQSQGISAHIHNQGTQGSLVHYNQGQWRSQGTFTTSQAANQAAAVLKAQGMSTRIVSR
jgi:hypothetical protein